MCNANKMPHLVRDIPLLLLVDVVTVTEPRANSEIADVLSAMMTGSCVTGMGNQVDFGKTK